ncbi:MAG: hypothetical protein DRG31_00150 [Deltaproteobacteria bacterium]|nr:MAG: hypothetical protein DRG31_00150 [Deltaproteobacteria bacterium]
MRILLRMGLGGSCLAAMFMVGVTFLDVISSKLFDHPVTGSYEFVALAQMLAIGLAGADAFVKGRHVQVEMFVNKMPPRLRRLTVAFVTILGILLFSVLTYEGFLYGESLRKVGETSGTVGIPLYPFAYVLAVSSLLLVLALLAHFVTNIVRGEG